MSAKMMVALILMSTSVSFGLGTASAEGEQDAMCDPLDPLDQEIECWFPKTCTTDNPQICIARTRLVCMSHNTTKCA